MSQKRNNESSLKKLNLYECRRVIIELCAAFRYGKIGGALGRRAELSLAVKCEGLKPEERLYANIMAAKLDTLMFAKADAEESLRPYVTLDNKQRAKPNWKNLESLENQQNSFITGTLFTEVANFLFRKYAFQEGMKIAERADSLLSKGDGSPDGLSLLLAKGENTIWLARLAARCNQQQYAEKILRKMVEEMESKYSIYKKGERGGIDHILAMAFDLWASFDWIRGDRSARQKIYRALFLLRDGEADDPIRLAHALYIAGKIEASYSVTDFEWPIRLLEDAQEKFMEYKHPLARRCAIQKAQCLTKADKREDARDVLNKAKAIEISDIEELTYSEAESTLTEVWIREAKARDKSGNWEDCIDEAKKLIAKIEHLPRRLQAETHLHYGIILIHLEKYADAQNHLDKAITLVEKDGRIKLKVGVCFAYAESYKKSGDPEKALKWWKNGLQLFANVQSSHLSQWKDRLAREFPDNQLIININPKQSKEEMKLAIRKALLLYREAVGSSSDNMSRATEYRWRKGAGMISKPRKQ
jgi:tetratricopeptide (TPR) repeat protein